MIRISEKLIPFVPSYHSGIRQKVVVFGDIDNTIISIKLVIIQAAFTMVTMAMKLMVFFLDWTCFPKLRSVILDCRQFCRQDNFPAKNFVKNIFSIYNWFTINLCQFTETAD